MLISFHCCFLEKYVIVYCSFGKLVLRIKSFWGHVCHVNCISDCGYYIKIAKQPSTVPTSLLLIAPKLCQKYNILQFISKASIETY